MKIKGLMRLFILVSLLAITLCLIPVVTFASIGDLSPAVSDLTKKFSEKFCTSIGNGMTPEKAGEIAAVQLSKGVLFSPVMNDIMIAPKEDLAASISNNIFSGCGNDLGVNKEELDFYLTQLSKKIPTKSTQNFQLPPTR